MASTKNHAEADGFDGAISGLSLPDLIQLNAANRFSGCITVQFGDQVGRIFFREGNLIHAEQGGKTGQDAACEILKWKTGRYNLVANVDTTSHTIRASVQQVLTEARRVIDERRASPPSTPKPAAAPAAQAKSAIGVALERLKAISGVVHAVVVSKSGVCLEDSSPQGEALAAKSAYLAMVGTRLGEILRTGPLLGAAMQGSPHHCLLLTLRYHYASLLLENSVDVGDAEVSARGVFSLNR